MKRREFMQMSLMFGVGSFLSTEILNNLSAQTSVQGKKVLLLFLRGGADVMSMFPTKDLATLSLYRDPKLVLAKNNYVGENLNLPYYLHPELSPLLPLFQKGQVALVPHTASLNKTRSHFQQQDLIESGSHISVEAQGILGKTSLLLGSNHKTVSMGTYLPYSFRGADPAMIDTLQDIKGALSDTKIRSGLSRDERLSLLKTKNVCSDQDKFCNRVEEARKSYQNLEHDLDGAQAPSGPSFVQHMDLAGQMISSPYAPSLLTVDMGGWDSHFNSFADNSNMTRNFAALAQGIMAFKSRVKETDWNNTVVVVISEFGRTIRSNKDFGTDHGAGSMMMLLGGGVNSVFKNSQIGWDLSKFEDAAGEVPASETGSSAALLRKIDYRLVMAEVFEKQFGISLRTQQEKIFTGFPGGNYLNILKG